MKEKIYTIPITEIFEEKCFCPFCKLFFRLSEEEVKYAIGPAMMEPDYRARTNKYGFCKEHMRELNSYPKALALSLVLDTHLDRINEALSKDLKPRKNGLFKKNDNSDIDKFTNDFNSFDGTCVICDKINHTFSRYMNTFIYMVDKDEEFLNKVLESDGFCMPHYTTVLNVAKNNLSPHKFVEIANKLNELERKKFSKYKTDIKNFIKSFDYQNAGKPCSAPGDTVVKTSFFLNGEFEKLTKKLTDV